MPHLDDTRRLPALNFSGKAAVPYREVLRAVVERQGAVLGTIRIVVENATCGQPAARGPALVRDAYGVARFLEEPCRRESGQAGADDEDVHDRVGNRTSLIGN